MATKAGPKVAKQPYVDTLDLLSRQRYLEKLRIVDVDRYALSNSAWSKTRVMQASLQCSGGLRFSWALGTRHFRGP